jgi:hypothetical protein
MKREIKRAAFAAADGLYRARNRRKPKLLVYTDSRGENLVSRLGKTGYGTYVNRLRSKYRLTYALCPESYTTIPDFLNFINRLEGERFDAIIMHCGIVDFSPRPLSGIAKFEKSKIGTPRFSQLFAKNKDYYSEPFDCEYYGERTVNIYSPEFLEDEILPELTALPRLVWINANHFVPGWNGNYTRGRPTNIDEVVSEFDAIMEKHLPRIVDLKTWTPDQVQRFTIDNLHFTQHGFDHVFDLVDQAIGAIVDPSLSSDRSAQTVRPTDTSSRTASG